MSIDYKPADIAESEASEVRLHGSNGEELLGQKSSSNSLPIVIASDQSEIPIKTSEGSSLTVRSLISNRVIWNTDSAWNKGILGTDIEIFGTGNAAVIRPNTESLPGTETPFEMTTRYKTSGHYETNIFDSQFLNQNWGILQIGASIPTGTVLVIKARTSNDKLIMGDYSDPLDIGEETELVGQYIQLSIDFTGTFTERAIVDYIAALYTTSLVNDVAP